MDYILKTQAGVTKEKYFMICEQMGITPDPSKIPRELSDMPTLVQIGNIIYKSLPDNFASLGMAGAMFVGKDQGSLGTFLDLYEVTGARDKQLVVDVILHLEKKAIEQAAAARKKKPGAK